MRVAYSMVESGTNIQWSEVRGMKCRSCNRPLKANRSRERGIGPQCERMERLERENENQVTLLTNKEVPQEIRRNGQGLATRLRYKGRNYVLEG